MSLVNTKEMLKKALVGKYAVGAFNINNMEILQAVVRAAGELSSPLILQTSVGALKYAGFVYLRKLVEAALTEYDIPVALHLDHGTNFEICKNCIDNGFTSVMIDGSALEYSQNVELTRKVVNYAHKYNVTVEGELGQLSGHEDSVSVTEPDSRFTDPDQAVDFARVTGVDSLAVAIGTRHGVHKFVSNNTPELKFDILGKIYEKSPELPIVLHGASSVHPEYIKKFNNYGGDLNHAFGIPEEQIKRAVQMSVCKINIDSDLRLAMTSSIREVFAQYPDTVDPRNYLGAGRQEVYNLVKHKIQNILGSAQKA